jgi:hypothetical protein
VDLVSLIARAPDGKMHMLPVQAQLNRRLAICPAARNRRPALPPARSTSASRVAAVGGGTELFSSVEPADRALHPAASPPAGARPLGAPAMRAKLGTSLNK